MISYISLSNTLEEFEWSFAAVSSDDKVTGGVLLVDTLNVKCLTFFLCVIGLPSTPEPVSTEIVDRDAMSVTWRKPSTDGGSPITDYIVEKRDTSGWSKVANVPSSRLSYTVPYLINGKEYQFRVTARNKVGSSEPVTGRVLTMKSPYAGKLFIEYF